MPGASEVDGPSRRFGTVIARLGLSPSVHHMGFVGPNGLGELIVEDATDRGVVLEAPCTAGRLTECDFERRRLSELCGEEGGQ